MHLRKLTCAGGRVSDQETRLESHRSSVAHSLSFSKCGDRVGGVEVGIVEIAAIERRIKTELEGAL
jgi:hypothetical protein